MPRFTLSDMCRSMVDEMDNPDHVGTPTTLNELLDAFAIGTPLCVVLVDAHWTAIEKGLDARSDAGKLTAMALGEDGMTRMGLPPAGQAVIKHAVFFQYYPQGADQPAAREQSDDEEAQHRVGELKVRDYSSMTSHFVICAAADVQGDARRELHFCKAVGVLTGQVRHGMFTSDGPLLQSEDSHCRLQIWSLIAVLLQKGLLPGVRACDGIRPHEHSWKPTPADYIEGGSAVLSGLQGRPELNGQECRLITWIEDAQRWAVELVKSGERVRVQPKNLSRTMAAYEGYGAGGAPLTRVPKAGTGECWHCGALPEDGETFPCCERCKRDKVIRVARYCSKACQAAAWPEHKQWHAQQAKGRALRVEHSEAHRTEPFVSLTFKEPWLQSMSLGNRAMHDSDFKRAAKEYSKAVTLAPHEPAPYFELGVAYSSSGLPQMAGPAFVQAMGLYSHGCQEWALAAASAIEAYTGMGNVALPDVRPKWMKTFAGLKANSLKIVAALVHNKAAPEASRNKYMGNGRVTKATLNGTTFEFADFKSRAWACRGAVLANSNDMSDLREAQRCYQNAADVLPADDPNRYMRVARAVQLRNVLESCAA